MRTGPSRVCAGQNNPHNKIPSNKRPGHAAMRRCQTSAKPGRTITRTLTESEKKIIAARQSWKCSSCDSVLPASYQVDHTIPLCDGGDDHDSNCTAMCASCHAAKTQIESVQRARQSWTAAQTSHEDREDTVSTNVATCTLCFQSREMHTEHVICRALDDPGSRERALTRSLAKFAFTKRIYPGQHAPYH